ncbi:Hypothetical protein NTJ_00398 [Nesidiocoris tenuis]|uniref:Uncharacterized protein n=1 Tax=Nesidiocoris tenuis TaxID=355587 RepID=A0ABN7A6Q6_9HEMI|nr:Hypothetical protein NTJ_00398 [Nesidiocoris tenuis]
MPSIHGLLFPGSFGWDLGLDAASESEVPGPPSRAGATEEKRRPAERVEPKNSRSAPRHHSRVELSRSIGL